MTAARQSTTINQLYTAIRAVLKRTLALADSHLLENYEDDPEPVQGEASAIYRLKLNTDDEHPGAGVDGHGASLTLEVIVYTRLHVDRAGSDAELARSSGRGHLVRTVAVRDGFLGRMLFDAYDEDGLPEDEATKILLEPMMSTQVPLADRPKRRPGFAQSPLRFSLRIDNPLTLPEEE